VKLHSLRWLISVDYEIIVKSVIVDLNT